MNRKSKPENKKPDQTEVWQPQHEPPAKRFAAPSACHRAINAITREKKNALIAAMNPRWHDLSVTLFVARGIALVKVEKSNERA